MSDEPTVTVLDSCGYYFNRDFYKDVAQDPSIPQRIRDTLRSIAYDRKHCHGEDAVDEMYNSMLNDFQPIIDDIKACGEHVDSQIQLLEPLVNSLSWKDPLTEGEAHLITVWDTTHCITSHLTGDTHV